jgi:hypothetical protein
MGQVTVLIRFFRAIPQDPHIGPPHIALYAALYHRWLQGGATDPVQAFSYEMMPLAKIYSSATYHRVLRELHAYGYVRYEPSYSRVRRSRIYLT